MKCASQRWAYSRCPPKDGSFKVRPTKVGTPQKGLPEIENLFVPRFEGAVALAAPPDHRQGRRNVGFRWFLFDGISPEFLATPVGPSGILPQSVSTPFDALNAPRLRISRCALRPLPDEGGQVLHDRPVVLGAFLGDTLERIDAAQPHLQLVATQLLIALLKLSATRRCRSAFVWA